MGIPRKAIVISNCQCQPLASALSVLSSETVFDPWAVQVPHPSQRAAAIRDLVAKVRQEYELVLTLNLSDDYLDIATSKIHETFIGIPIVTISNIYFSGLHPDLTYIGGLAARVTGPMMAYHSKLALYAFLKGLSLDDALSLYNDSTYVKAKYYDEYEKSLTELNRRDHNVSVKLTNILPELLKNCYAFYTVNHPTSAIFVPYAEMIVRHLESIGLGRSSGLPANPFICESVLAHYPIFPVYSEIAQRYKVPALGSYAFKPSGARKNPLSLPTFLAAEFATFQSIGIDALMTHAVSKNIISTMDDYV